MSLKRRGRIIGSAAVLKTAARKGMQVRVLSPPPFLFNDLPLVIRSHSIRPSLALTVILQRKGRTLDAMADSIAALRRRASAQDQNLEGKR